MDASRETGNVMSCCCRATSRGMARPLIRAGSSQRRAVIGSVRQTFVRDRGGRGASGATAGGSRRRLGIWLGGWRCGEQSSAAVGLGPRPAERDHQAGETASAEDGASIAAKVEVAKSAENARIVGQRGWRRAWSNPCTRRSEAEEEMLDNMHAMAGLGDSIGAEVTEGTPTHSLDGHARPRAAAMPSCNRVLPRSTVGHRATSPMAVR